MAPFSTSFFAKCLCPDEDGLWMGASVSYWHISSFSWNKIWFLSNFLDIFFENPSFKKAMPGRVGGVQCWASFKVYLFEKPVHNAIRHFSCFFFVFFQNENLVIHASLQSARRGCHMVFVSVSVSLFIYIYVMSCQLCMTSLHRAFHVTPLPPR